MSTPPKISGQKSFLALAWASVFMCGSTGSAQAQVKYFDHVPTATEIQAALSTPVAAPANTDTPAPDGRTTRKTRGLEWNVGAAASTTAASAPQPQEPSSPAIALPVNFEYGTAHVSKASLAYIEAIVSVLNQSPDMHLTVEGHTDVSGSPRNNLMLSWDRAFSVFRVMVEKYGIDPARLQPSGKGSTEPISSIDPLNGMNRRVQFRIAR